MQIDQNFEPGQEILILIALSSNEGSGESAHMHVRRLVRAFTARIHKLWMKVNTQIKT